MRESKRPVVPERIRDEEATWCGTDYSNASSSGGGDGERGEGQIGAFYPFNWIFYFFLPLKAAYSGIIMFHYFLGAFIFYLFAKRLGLSAMACLFATLIYVFGSTQCGYFYYNFISQRIVSRNKAAT